MSWQGINTPESILKILKKMSEKDKSIIKDKDSPKNNQGYNMIRVNGYRIRKTRYVWEQHYGKIPKGILIHHKNKIKDDDRIENLQLVTTKEHGILHSKSK